MSEMLIDGEAVPVAAGQTIMQAALAAKVYIPRLCHHPDYAPHGSCKLCTVKADGRYVSACTFPAKAGMVVENNTEELTASRRALTQMLFVDGNHFCPYCEKSGNCQLQALAYSLGMNDPHFHSFFPRRQVDASHPEVLIDRDRCIFCALCVRASRESDGKDVFGLSGRGRETNIAVNSPSGLLADSDIALGDRALEVCPVGAILVRGRGFSVPIGERIFDRKTISEL